VWKNLDDAILRGQFYPEHGLDGIFFWLTHAESRRRDDDQEVCGGRQLETCPVPAQTRGRVGTAASCIIEALGN
jgi:hypothetical protein